MELKQKIKAAKSKLHENVEYRLTDSAGNVKELFQDNFINRTILRAVRSFYNPRKSDGTVKDTLMAKIALYGIRIPHLTGRWVRNMQIANLVTDAGKAGVASRINGAGSEAVFDYIAIGTGTTAAASGDTSLQTETHREQATASRTTTDVTDDTSTLVNTFNFSSSNAITESGVLNSNTGGTLLCRQVFSAINVADGDSLQVTWDIDVD